MTPDPNDDALWAMSVPPGEVRTAINPPSSGQSLLAAGIATTVIALLAVLTRVFTRFYVVKGPGLDDCKLRHVLDSGSRSNGINFAADLVMISMVLALVYSVLTLYCK